MKKITFTLPAEALGEATVAFLLGDFNNWNLDEAVALEVQKDGTLKAVLPLEEGKTYEYRYLLNDGTWLNDFSAENYVHKPGFDIENSVITVPVTEVIIEETIAIIETEKPVKKAKTEKVAKAKQVVAKKETTKKVVAKKAEAAPKVKPEAAPAKDKLTKIEGIGPKIAELLEAEGIASFKDLSKASVKNLKAILEAAGAKFKVHNPASWPKQAKLAAEAKWEKLAELQAELKGGK